jgi:hypothetical protein
MFGTKRFLRFRAGIGFVENQNPETESDEATLQTVMRKTTAGSTKPFIPFSNLYQSLATARLKSVADEHSAPTLSRSTRGQASRWCGLCLGPRHNESPGAAVSKCELPLAPAFA